MSDAVLANLPSKIVVIKEDTGRISYGEYDRKIDAYNLNLLGDMLVLFRKSILSAKELQSTNVDGAVGEMPG